MSNNDIEGELVDEGESAELSSTTEIVKHDDAGAAQVFNPLDVEPVAFTRMLANRQENYDQLKMHLIGVLVPGKDFGKIHVKKDCSDKYNCTNDYHFSGFMLFAPGADKILGILGLSVHYPDLQDYKRAVLKGIQLEEIIADAQILGHSDQVIATGVGACARSEPNINDLNRCIKRACKRARLDAVNRLPVISALFEDNFLQQVADRAKQNKNNSTASRAQKVKNQWDTGARLEVCPIGKEMKGKAWRDIETDALEWIVANVTDKPDVKRAAASELSKRPPASDSGSKRSSSPSDSKQHANE